MDLLGSILNSMDKPPAVGGQNKEQRKRQEAAAEKLKEKERARMNQFRKQVEEKINSFIQDSTLHKYKFDPMDKVCRSIVLDVADVAGLTAFSFGEEEVDRYVMLFKKEYAPGDEELTAYRRGEEWDPEEARRAAKQRELERHLEEEEDRLRPRAFVPATNYKDKYEHLIGKTAAIDAARKTQANKQFGFVPSGNKQDKRSIEQTLADIRAKKKQKVEADGDGDSDD